MFKVGDKVKLFGTSVNNLGIGEDVFYGKENLFIVKTDDGSEFDICVSDIKNDNKGIWYNSETVGLVDENNEAPLDEQTQYTSEFISLDYRTEYHNKVAECEKLKAQVEYLWKQVLGE